MRRRAVAGGVALLLAVAGGAVALVHAREGQDDARPALDPAQARAQAVLACADAARFESLVRQNARVDDVRRALGQAESRASTAAGADPTWVGLSGGLQSVRVALDADDARAAQVGIAVVRSECRRVVG